MQCRLVDYDPFLKRYICKAGHKHKTQDSALSCHWCKRDMERERERLGVKPNEALLKAYKILLKKDEK
jgi:hypothetical protein